MADFGVMRVSRAASAALPAVCILPVAGVLAARALKKRIKRAIAYNVEELLRHEALNVDRERQRKALQQTAEFVESTLSGAARFTSREEMLEHALGSVPAGLRGGIYCELGVYEGQSINFLAPRVAGAVHGFDSFEGLPSDWRENHPAGQFRVASLPRVPPNVVLHKGWFDATLPGFSAAARSPIAFMHVDCDLYSSTRTVFDLLGDLVAEGTIIVFDEYFNYPGWAEGEHRALLEYAAATGTRFEYLSYNSRSEQVAVRITAAPAYRFRPAATVPSPAVSANPAK